MYIVCVRRTVNSYAVQLSSVTTRTAAPAKPKLGRDTVMDAAMAIADAEGLDAVTIRRIATGLSVTPMALYWHFKDKDALLAAMADRMWEGAQDVLEHSITQRESSRIEGDEREGDGDDWTVLRLTLAALLAVMPPPPCHCSACAPPRHGVRGRARHHRAHPRLPRRAGLRPRARRGDRPLRALQRPDAR